MVMVIKSSGTLRSQKIFEDLDWENRISDSTQIECNFFHFKMV